MRSYFRDRLDAGVGVAWYKRNHFEEARRIMFDADDIPEEFDDWQRLAKRQEREILAQGGRPFRVYIIPNEFERWCVSHGHRRDEKGRKAYASELAHWTSSRARR